MALEVFKKMSDFAIETIDLTKIYKMKGNKKSLKVLDKISLSVKKGEIFGLLGPNGAGKTTLIQILTTIKQPTSGEAFINGYDIIKNPNQAKSNIALMMDWKMLYYRLTVYDNMKFFCRIYEVPNYKKKIDKLVEEFNLKKWLHESVHKLSTGMMMKLALMRTLILDRDTLFLDEPTLGLDVVTVDYITEKIKNTNKTIFLTSHDMRVVDKLCDRIAFINQGRIISIGTKEDLEKYDKKEIQIIVEIDSNRRELTSELKQQDFISEVYELEKFMSINLSERKNLRDLLAILGKYDVQKVYEREMALEDLFLKINK